MEKIYGAIDKNGGASREICPLCGDALESDLSAEKPTSQPQNQESPDAKVQETASKEESVSERPAETADSTETAEPQDGQEVAAATPQETKKHDGYRKCNIGAFTTTLHNDCLAKVNSAIQADNDAFKKSPNNVLKGFWGALIGGVVGAVATVILALFGLVSAIPALVSVILGAFLYQKFHGKPNAVMVVVVAVTTIVCMILTVVIIYLFVAKALAMESGVDMSSVQAFSHYMKEMPEFSAEFWRVFGFIMLYSVIGVGVEIFDVVRKIQRQKAII